MSGRARTTPWGGRRSDLPTQAGRDAADDEARVEGLRELVRRLRTDAGLTQTELAVRMRTTQSSIARLERGGTRPTLETLEKVARAVGADLVVAVGANLARQGTIAELQSRGFAVVRRATRFS
ncbi:MAG: helix-turn-helix transcriptional regulator [Actinobacteria bacterium]|nr:helix-turn-helix transcriptional regulator [Actinomycetota bacterium]MCB9390914.1 helix-turn-helix transcriptional regulator [Acidimicrobiia bacterium]